VHRLKVQRELYPGSLISNSILMLGGPSQAVCSVMLTPVQCSLRGILIQTYSESTKSITVTLRIKCSIVTEFPFTIPIALS
jgi:hypothetical protein